MAMGTIECSVCFKVIAYTSRAISKPRKDYLFSEKLTVNQKCARMDKEKLIYCPDCYTKGVAEARKKQDIAMKEEEVRRRWK